MLWARWAVAVQWKRCKAVAPSPKAISDNCSGSYPEWLHIGVNGLIVCHLGVVKPHVDGSHNGVTEAVSHKVGFGCNMLYVRGELGDERQLMLLVGRPRLRHLSHGKRKGFMVDKSCKLSPLQQCTKVSDVPGQKCCTYTYGIAGG